jgi:DNA gyrase/topoisomerase IV subunit B
MFNDQITLSECKLEKQTREINELQAKLVISLAETKKKEDEIFKLEKEVKALVSRVSENEITLTERDETIQS